MTANWRLLPGSITLACSAILLVLGGGQPAPASGPEVEWSTYLGGSANDFAYGVVLDEEGNVYTTGSSDSTGWVSGGYDTVYNGTRDAIAVKFSPSGEHLWSTYIGGTGRELAYGMAIDTEGNVYVAGETRSVGWVTGGFDTEFGGDTDAFVTKLTGDGQHLWSTYLGGSGADIAREIEVDAEGNVYVTGVTGSAGWVSGGFNTEFSGPSDAFVAKLSPEGGHIWSTYLGGNGSDDGRGITVDLAGDVYVAGVTESEGWVSGGFDTEHGGGQDAFVAKLSFDGDHIWSTYFGGSGNDRALDVAVDEIGAAYITGDTASDGWTSGGYNTELGGATDSFAVKISPQGEHIWSTYVGGDGSDRADGVTVDGAGNVFLIGRTDSTDWVEGGFDTEFNGSQDAFVAKLSYSGRHLWSSYMGGVNRDQGCGIVLDPAGYIYVTGDTLSPGWTAGGHDTQFNGLWDIFIVKIQEEETEGLPSAWVVSGL